MARVFHFAYWKGICNDLEGTKAFEFQTLIIRVNIGDYYLHTTNTKAVLFSCHKAINIKWQPFCQSDVTVEVLSELKQNVPLPKRQKMWFVHGRAAVRFARNETQFYNTVCPNRCVERKRTLLWPSRSPDLLPGYFCLCSHLKSIVYLKRVTSKHELWRLIELAKIVCHLSGIFATYRAVLVSQCAVILSN